jgi:senataxin
VSWSTLRAIVGSLNCANRKRNREIKQLDPRIHLFCPKQGDNDQDQYQHDQEAKIGQEYLHNDRLARIEEAKSRRKKFISTLQLLAYDGEDTEQYQRYIWERLDEALGSCDVCIREYYIGKRELLAGLREEYDDEEVQKFFAIIDRRDISRIIEGLSQATKTLQALPEQKRRAGALQPEHLHAIFEALVCEAFLRDDKLLQQHFDEPFKLVQTKKPLKIREYLPAVAHFLFESNESRFGWAQSIWDRMDRAPTDVEWNWAIREVLQKQLQEATAANELQKLWHAMNIVVRVLDEDQITHYLFDLVPNICTTALNHLAKRSSAPLFIVQTMRTILEKAPDAFWQSLGSISSSTFVEQIFASPNFNKLLQDSTIDGGDAARRTEVLSWIPSLLHSLKAANRPPACHTLVLQLFERVHNDHISLNARRSCYEMAVRVMLETIMSFSDNETVRLSVDRVVLSDILNTISHRMDEVLNPPGLQQSGTTEEKSRPDVLALVRNALALECICLKADFESLSKNEESPRESSSYSPDIWNCVINSLSDDNVDLSMAAVRGIMALPGLEQFRAKDMSLLSKNKQSYNLIFNKVTGMESRILERLAEFSPSHLDALFKTQDTSMSLIAALFSADSSTYQAAVDLVKNIGGLSGRKEALGQLLNAFLDTTVYSICWVFRRISNMKTFGPVPRLLATGMEILEVLCNKEDGILRGKTLKGREVQAIQSYWSYQWMALTTVFRQTEKWSLEVHDKPRMTEVCRNAMQYAEALFEEYDLFASALIKAKPDLAKDVPKTLLDSSNSSTFGSPLKTLDSMSRWLRLRDEYLADTLVKLIAKMLDRLKSRDVLVTSDGLSYVEDVATKTTIKTILSESQKAVLVRSLEAYYGKRIVQDVPKAKKQSTLRDWADSSTLDRSGASTSVSRELSVDEFDEAGVSDKDFMEILSGKSLDIHKASLAAKAKEKSIVGLTRTDLSRLRPTAAKDADAGKKALEAKAFIENRKREMAAAKLKQKEMAAKLRGKIGVGEQTKGQGSGLSGIGIKGKEHSSGPNSMMVSSESEPDSDDSDDEALFGSKVQSVQQSSRGQPAALPARALPTKKIKQQRSYKDVRARLQPDLSTLHKTILSWDFFAESELPPNSDKEDYALVTNVFKTATDYQNTFEPLLILEGWQSFRSAREDGNFKLLEVAVSNSLLIDSFVEVNTTIKLSDRPGISVADIVLLSKSKTPETEPDQPHCLARVKEVSMKKGDLQVVYRMNASGNSLRPFLNDKSVVYGVQVLSMTPLEREYGALKALQYYDLCEEVIRAKPSPILDYTEPQLHEIVHVYDVNMAQAKAVRCAMDNDAFTLIQGPPGSGKTKTICALVGAMMSNMQGHSRPRPTIPNGSRLPAPPPTNKKILVCAPSNAAVDELVMRFKAGVKMMNGSMEKLSVVRLGRSDAINANVKDVTLEELVNAKLNLAAPKEREDINIFMMEHKETSQQFHALRERINESRARGQAIEQGDENTLDGLGRKKKALGLKIDEMRERQNSASRDAELNRRRIQQQILDSAHVLCATLSGSGHEIFQGLNIEFETVIIDEAAQSIELSALIPLKYGCSKCILVGDPKQLPPTVLSREAARYQYQQSLFARMEKNHPKDVHLLDTQYRMHPEISLFPSKTFYDSRLKDGPGMAQLRRRPWHHSSLLGPYRFFDVQGMSVAATKGHSMVNFAELNVAMQLYDRLVTDVRRYDFRGKVGIITPYKGQLKALKERFSQKYGNEITSIIEFNTTDAFQGRESEIIIFSCVRASTKGIGFLNDIRRMNVGLTRAKSSLWVLGNSESLIQGEFWRSLVNDAKSRNLYTDGDISRLLQRPLLTEDMMKEDIEMTDADLPSASASRKPSVSDTSTDARRASTVTPGSNTLKDLKSSTSVLGNITPLPARPDSSMSRGSSSTSVAKTAVPWPQSSVANPAAKGEARPDIKRQTSIPKLDSGHESKPKTLSESKPKTHGRDSDETSGSGGNGPSGGRTGLNDLAVCQRCGSDAHFSHKCDNVAARSASIGTCYRCNLPGHTQNFCSAPRCLECGEVGHSSIACKAPLNRRLSPKDKEDVKRQEIARIRSKNDAKERRAERQLGDHVPKIPAVKSTMPPSAGLDSLEADGKRKRDDSPPLDAPKGPKVMKSMDGTLESGSGMGPDSRLPLNGGPMRGPRKLGTPMIKKKRPKDDDMFMKRK